jgi:hypothetical protein
MKCSTVLEVASMGTWVTAPQVVSLVDLLRTMSLRLHPLRNRQSTHATYAVPAASISADGSGDSRNPPAPAAALGRYDNESAGSESRARRAVSHPSAFCCSARRLASLSANAASFSCVAGNGTALRRSKIG